MLDPLRLKLAVGRAATIMPFGAFPAIMSYWQRGNEPKLQDFISPTDDVVLLEPDEDPIVIEGDCQRDITLVNGSVLLISGDLRATVHTEGHCELIVAGDITQKATVLGNGIVGVHVFVGGNVLGALRFAQSGTVWIQSDFRGVIEPGREGMTHIHVVGDCYGAVKATSAVSLVSLVVEGFMPSRLLEAIQALGCWHFEASIQQSDCPPGIYPDPTLWRTLREKRRVNRWVIHEHRPDDTERDAPNNRQA